MGIKSLKENHLLSDDFHRYHKKTETEREKEEKKNTDRKNTSAMSAAEFDDKMKMSKEDIKKDRLAVIMRQKEKSYDGKTRNELLNQSTNIKSKQEEKDKTAKNFEEYLEQEKKKENRDKIEIEGGETNLQWRTPTYQNSPDNSSWAEDAINPMGNIVYRLYYETVKEMTILEDIREGINYNITTGAKAKGYVLAFKLNTKHIRRIKKLRNEKNENILPF